MKGTGTEDTGYGRGRIRNRQGTEGDGYGIGRVLKG